MHIRTQFAFIRAIRAAAALAFACFALGSGNLQAAVGDVLRTVTVGAQALCAPSSGTSVALVQGTRVGLPQYPVLLVTTCFAAGGSASAKAKRATLYFLDPANGAVVKTVQTRSGTAAFAPGNGWAQVVLAANKGVLYGCGDEGSLYSIDYISTNTVTDGTLTQVTVKPAAATTCAGLAWDPSNSTIYQAAGATIYHFNPTGAALPNSAPASFPAPTNCTVSGLTAVGGLLLVACSNNGTVKRIDKTSGALLANDPSLTFPSTALADLECDAVTFGTAPFPSEVMGETAAVWSKRASSEHVTAYRMPAAFCGLPPKATALAPAACPADPKYVNPDGSPKDTDGDGLWDCWEDHARWSDGKPGLGFTDPAVRDLVLCVNVDTNGDGVPDTEQCVDPNVKDLLVEIDFMEDPGQLRSHRPDPLAILAVRNAFAAAPVDAPNGVRVHFFVDEAVPHANLLAFEPCTGPAVSGAAVYDTVKTNFFGSAAERSNINTVNAKIMAYRYMFFAHQLIGTTSSGCGEIVGDDSAVTLGNFGPADSTGHRRGTTDQQAGTVMHELGHNLGLEHGGGDKVNCKPNYLSVMSYSRQFADFITNRPLNYSSTANPTLNETTGLNETVGIGAISSFPSLEGARTVYSRPTASSVVVTLGVTTGTAIDWNGDGDVADGGAVSDVNKMVSAGCDGSGTLLVGHNDWEALSYNPRASLDFSSGAPDFESDKTPEQEQASFDEADRDANGFGDAFACGPTLTQPRQCLIDVKPNESPNIVNVGKDANIRVAILSNTDFDAPTAVIRNTLRLNDTLVRLNQGGEGACTAQKNGNLRDLVCQFDSTVLPVGTNYVIVEGQAMFGSEIRAFRARDIITVVK